MKDLKQAILNVDDLPREAVEVKAWGVTVYLRPMTGTERDAYEAVVFKTDGTMKREDMRAELLVRCLVDASGNRLFGDDEVAALGGKNSAVLCPLFLKAQRINGIGVGSDEEMEKN
ncbi:MAG: hypothetical protein AB7E47_03330 [Desulfovibrionaceae bacterium]